MQGFFHAAEIPSKRISIPLLPSCGSCGLYKTCISPKMPPTGKGRKRILVLGEAPGRTEDQLNKQFIGDSGQLLRRTLRKFGIDFEKDCWVTNAAICRPPKNKLPEKAVEYCRPNMVKTVEELNPEIIILLGSSAVESMMGWIWKEEVGPIVKWLGWQIPSQQLNAWVCPTWHPAYILRTDYGTSQKENEVRTLLFEKHIREAIELQGRPWKKAPDYDSRCQIFLDCDEAADKIASLAKNAESVAFDLECDRLKPDHQDSTIICCSMSDGKTSLSYPWLGKAIDSTLAVLFSDKPKRGWNLKYEDRWIRKKYKKPVKNWLVDGMQLAHVLDNRKQITGLKFQAFVKLGVGSYDHAIKPYMRAKGGNSKNRLHEVDLKMLLKYCAMDSLVEWKVTDMQEQELQERS